MVITFPSKPSDFLFDMYFQSSKTIYINQDKYNSINSILIFYITTGKYINGYNLNGSRTFTYLVPMNVSKLTILNSSISFTF